MTSLMTAQQDAHHSFSMHCSLIRRAAQASQSSAPGAAATATRTLTAAPAAQQRLFTGALFPEGVNEELRAFALRHRAQSNVWVPVQAVETMLKPYGIFILPNAALCDISLTTGGNTQDYTELSAALSDRILVNADHTSNPHLLESFREMVVAVPAPPPSGATGTQREDSHRPRQLARATQPLAFPRFQHPLTTEGVPILNRSRHTKLMAKQSEHQFHSNYWFRTGRNQQFAYHNAEETGRPGVFNPTWCVHYTPHTITGQLFPKLVARLMRQRAVECGYVSRLWLTVSTAARCFGAHLAPEHEADAPAVHTTFFTGGLACTTYYCADQFVCHETSTSAAPLAAPRLRDIELAASGVAIAPHKLRAFPLLRQLSPSQDASQRTDRSCVLPRAQSPPLALCSRRGADATMEDASRHTRFVEATSRYRHIQLLGDAYMANHARMVHVLHASGLGTALQRQCVLRGFPTPFFVSSRSLCDYGLDILPEEEGFVWETCVQLNGTLAHLDGECWFNVSQLQEPDIALHLFLHRPVHFLSRTLLSKAQALLCVRLQAHVARGSDGCREWIPQRVLSQARWPLRSTACAVPMLGVMERPSQSHIQAFGDSCTSSASGAHGGWFNLDDVLLPDKDKEWLRTYSPVNRSGQPFLRALRMVMTLRAFERGYQSVFWVCLEEEAHRQVEQRVTREPGHTDENLLPLTLREMAAPALPDRAMSTEGALANPPFVMWSGLRWVNAEELVDPPPAAFAAVSQPLTDTFGKGVSAESYTHWRLHRAEQAEQAELMMNSDDGENNGFFPDAREDHLPTF